MTAIQRIDAYLSTIRHTGRIIDEEYASPDRVSLWDATDIERLSDIADSLEEIVSRLNISAEASGEDHGVAPDDAELLDLDLDLGVDEEAA